MKFEEKTGIVKDVVTGINKFGVEESTYLEVSFEDYPTWCVTIGKNKGYRQANWESLMKEREVYVDVLIATPEEGYPDCFLLGFA